MTPIEAFRESATIVDWAWDGIRANGDSPERVRELLIERMDEAYRDCWWYAEFRAQLVSGALDQQIAAILGYV